LSEGIKFGNLNYLLMLWLIPVAYFLLWLGARLRRRGSQAFSSPQLAPRLLFSSSPARERLKMHLFALSFLFIALALIRPMWGYRTEEVKLRGPDIMVALDVSRSMLAQDVAPDRLTRAKLELKNFATRLPTGRAGLVVFAGTAFTQCPITSDYSAFRMFVDEVSVQSVPYGGTAIGEAIRRCVSAFESAGSAERIILLISDGEDLGGDAIEAAREAAKKDVLIYTVGVGSREGAPIPVRDDQGNVSFVKESDGTVHLSKLSEQVLRRIASETGGTYSGISSPSWDIERRISARPSEPGAQTETRVVRYYYERFQLPLFLALFFLIVEALVPRGRRMNSVEVGR